MKHIERASGLYNISNVPDNINQKLLNISTNSVYETIRYYYKKFTDLDILDYEINDTTIKTNTTPLKTEYSGFKDTKSSYSNYNEKILKNLDHDINSIWNGDSIIMYINDNKINIVESDYYTNRTTVSLLYYESAKAFLDANEKISDLKKEYFPLRNKLLSNRDNFKMPDYATGASSGGIIFGKIDSEWYMLLGKRSDEVNVNEGYYSIVPNGGIEYELFSDNLEFLSTTRREFSEEIAPDDSFFDEYVESKIVYNGWDLKSGGLSSGHALFIKNQNAFERLNDSDNINFEFSEFEIINVNDIEKINSYVTFDKFSPSVIPIVINGLREFNHNKELPDLPYNICENRI